MDEAEGQAAVTEEQGLQDLGLRLGYDTADEALRDFYVPALSRAVSYDRSVGYFRVSALSVAAKGLSRFIAGGGRARFLIGAEVGEAEREALVGAETIPPSFAAQLAEGLVPADEIAHRRLQVLAWLVKEKRLAIRVAVAVDDDGVPTPPGVEVPYFHEKIGVLRDRRGDGVVFQGSVNESEKAWLHNFESFSVFKSWDGTSVFEDLTTTGVASNGFPEGIITPENVARLSSQLATLRYAYVPRRGLGYSLSATADRAILTGVPLSVGGIQIPANNVQICGNGTQNPGIPTCIPYLKGYQRTTYTWNDGTFMALGVDYEGKNNTYFQPPFALVDFTYRHPITKQIDLQVGVENLLNTNNYGQYLSIPNGGTPIVADNPNGSQTSFVPTEVSAPPRLIRLQLRYHFGR